MMQAEELRGIYVPVVTPFHADGELDLESFQTYLGDLLTRDIQGIVINGTTGESPTTTWEEVVLLTQEARRIGGSGLPIIVGTGTNDTRSTVRRTELAGAIGADAALVVVPYYSRPSQEGIFEHYRKAAGTGVPVVAYEVPARTGVRLETETARAILALDGVIGLKDSSGGTALVRELARGSGGRSSGATRTASRFCAAMTSASSTCCGLERREAFWRRRTCGRATSRTCTACMQKGGTRKRGSFSTGCFRLYGCCSVSRTRLRSSGCWRGSP